MCNRNLLTFAIFFFTYLNLFSQLSSSSSLKHSVFIDKLDNPIHFDGVPDEEAWASIDLIKLIMHSPTFGIKPTEDTEIRFAYDDEYLWIGAILYYNDVGIIKSASYKRDYMGKGCDYLGVILDTYNDKENGVVFITTPDGLRFDASVQRDAVTTLPTQEAMNLNWNAFWEVLTKKFCEGWTTEIKIPLSSLRFQEINGEVRMGLIVQRWISAKNETNTFPAILPNWGEISPIKPSQAQEIVLRGIKSAKPFYIAPYALASYESKRELFDNEDSYRKFNNPALRAGLDVKYGLSSNLILDFTVNTDFSQVEADDQKINLTRMALFLPEKRLFFLERSDIFNFNSSGNNNLFYSRRIGLSEDCDPIRIYGGGRFTGKFKEWDLGLLNIQTAPLWLKNSSGIEEEKMPSENFGVMRLRRRIINENSYVGSMVTSRLGFGGSFNVAYGLDGSIRLYGNDYFSLVWSQTFEDTIKNNSVLEPTRFMIAYERRSKKGLGFDIRYIQSGVNYNPGIGFESRDNYSIARATIQYGWMPGSNSRLYWHSPSIILRYFTYVDDGSFMSFHNHTGWNFQSKSIWKGEMFFVHDIEDLRDSLEIQEDKVYVAPGKYNFFYMIGNLFSPVSKPFFATFNTETGQYYDGIRLSFRIEPTWNISKHLELAAVYNFDYVDFSRRNVKMINHITGIKVLYMFDTHFSAFAYVQYNTDVNEIITNIRFRYNPKEGNDLYLLFNEGRNTNLIREIPNLPVYFQRSVMIKYSYTFNLL